MTAKFAVTEYRGDWNLILIFEIRFIRRIIFIEKI